MSRAKAIAITLGCGYGLITGGAITLRPDLSLSGLGIVACCYGLIVSEASNTD